MRRHLLNTTNAKFNVSGIMYPGYFVLNLAKKVFKREIINI